MPGFSIAPVGPFPDPASDNFPDFMQFQSAGIDLGDRAADTLNFTGGLVATRGVGENESTVSVTAGALSWRTVLGDDTIGDDDIGNGLWVDATSGVAQISVPSMAPGDSVLIQQAGSASVQLIAQSGVTLLYRTDTFAAETAGQGAILTLIAGPAGSHAVVVCGDMAPA